MPDGGPDTGVELEIMRRALEARDRRIAQLVIDTLHLRELEKEVIHLRKDNVMMLSALKECEKTLSFISATLDKSMESEP